MHCSSSSYLPKTIHKVYRLRRVFDFWEHILKTRLFFKPSTPRTEHYWGTCLIASVLVPTAQKKSSAKALVSNRPPKAHVCALPQQPLGRRKFIRFPWRGYDLIWCPLNSARGIESSQSPESSKTGQVMSLLSADELVQTLCRTRKMPHLTVCMKCKSQLACDHLTFDSATEQTITQLQICTYVTQEYLPVVFTSCCKAAKLSTQNWFASVMKIDSVADTLWSVHIKHCFLKMEAQLQDSNNWKQNLLKDSPKAVTS